MSNIFPILIAVIAVVGLVIILSLVAGSSNKGDSKSTSSSGGKARPQKQKGRQAIIHDATKKLAQNPQNPAGLIPLSDLYFREGLWEKAYPLYQTMTQIAPVHTQINASLAALRQGICAMKLDKIDDAVASLTSAYTKDPDNFDATYNLGLALYKMNSLEKAIPMFKKSLINKPDASSVYEYLGFCFYKLKRYKESLPWLKKALDIQSDNKELLFSMASAMFETGYGDKALKIFMHLRVDPIYGPQSCLQAGMSHLKVNNTEAAIQDFEIGLKHTTAPQEIALEIKYRLANCYLANNNIAQGLSLLNQIANVNIHFKDVPALISRYQELNQNSNLQVYLQAGSSDFVALCRKLVAIYFAHSSVHILDITVESVSTEILTEIETTKWEDVAVFRFYRTTGSTGELYIRDFHGKIHDAKAGRGICITAGTFTDEAKKFADGRPIDLVEKTALIQLLKKIH